MTFPRAKAALAAALIACYFAATLWIGAEVCRLRTAPTVTIHHQAAPQAKIVELPEDGQVWFTSLFVHDDWKNRPADRRLVADFDAIAPLQSLKAQTHFHVYTASDPNYRERFARDVNVLPCVLIQRANGEIVYKESGANVGCQPDGLARSIQAGIRRHCPDGKCGPLPPPADEIPPDEPHETPPELPLLPAAKTDAENPWLIVGCVAAGCALAFLLTARRDFRP